MRKNENKMAQPPRRKAAALLRERFADNAAADLNKAKQQEGPRVVTTHFSSLKLIPERSSAATASAPVTQSVPRRSYQTFQGWGINE